MKKFLSLALALVMTMSLVTISAGATFTDDDAIAYSEAVDVMAAIEIIGGYADGSFAPTATLTRGAAAKIICNMILGPTTAGALVADAAPFPDVAASHVFAGYIAYCANQGILSGYQDGNFYPDGTVTGYQFMKMLLGALGYDASIEGFTGDNWSVNVAKLAIAMGLDDGNEDYVGTAAMTREEACLYAFNTLQATMVEYDSNSSITVGDIVITNSSTAKDVTSTKDTICDEGYLEFAEKYFTDLEKEVTTDAFGRPVTVWDLDNDEIGEYVDTADLIASYENKVTKSTIYSLIDNDFGTEASSDPTLTVYVNGYAVSSEEDYCTDAADFAGFEISDYTLKSSSSASASSGNGTITEVYEDDDENITIVTIQTFVLQAQDDYDDGDEILEVAFVDDDLDLDEDELSVDDFDVEDYEEYDYILAWCTLDEYGDYTVEAIFPAETVSGEVTSYSYESSVTVDGTKYSYSKTISDDHYASSFTSGQDAILVLDAAGYVIAVDTENVASDNYLYIFDIDGDSFGTGSEVYAAAYFTDGSYSKITIDDWDYAADGSDYSGTEEDNYGWYAYNYSSSADEYDLIAACDNDDDYDHMSDYTIASGTDLVVSGTTKAVQDVFPSIKANSSTVLVLLDDDGDTSVYTGVSNFPDITSTDAYMNMALVYDVDTDYATVIFVDAFEADNDGIDGASSVTDYVYVLDLDETYWNSDNDKIYVYNAIIDGEETSFETESSASEYSMYENFTTDGDYYKVSTKVIDGTGTYGTSEVVALDFDGSIEYSDGVLEIDGYSFLIESDSTIWNIALNDDDSMVDEGIISDESNDYEVTDITGSKIDKLYDDYSATGIWYAIMDDEDSTTIESIFVVVSAVV